MISNDNNNNNDCNIFTYLDSLQRARRGHILF